MHMYIYIYKFQPPGLFLVVKGPKFQTLGGFWYIYIYCIKNELSILTWAANFGRSLLWDTPTPQ